MRAMLLFVVLATAAAAQTREPVLPFYDWGACPGEGCSYRQWTASEPVPLYDTWKPDRHKIAQIAKGEQVTGLAGVVITFRPGMIRLERDFPEQQFKRGDTLLTYTYRGEGNSAVWFAGVYQPSYDIAFATYPDGTGCHGPHCAARFVDLGEKSWWAQVKLKSGREGWVEMDKAHFDCVCMSCGSATAAPAEARLRGLPPR